MGSGLNINIIVGDMAQIRMFHSHLPHHLPAIGGWWWRHHKKVPRPRVGVEFGMIVSAVDLVKPEPVAHLSEYFQAKDLLLVQGSR